MLGEGRGGSRIGRKSSGEEASDRHSQVSWENVCHFQ